MRTVTREDIYREFAQLVKHPLDLEIEGNIDELYRRFEFLMSEVNELAEAISDIDDEWHDKKEISRERVAHLLKEMTDVQYTLSGLAETFGLDLEIAYRRTHASNMSKALPDGPTYDANGKVQKGPNYKPPYLGDLV